MPTEHVLTAVVTRDGLNPAIAQEFMASIKGRVEVGNFCYFCFKGRVFNVLN